MIFYIIIGIVVGTIIGMTIGVVIGRWAVSELRSNANAAIRNWNRAAEVEKNATEYVRMMNLKNGQLLNEIQALSVEVTENATDHVHKVNMENGTLLNENRKLLNEIQKLKQEKESKPGWPTWSHRDYEES
jgi:gas vesicle protein